ncbi:hypothetical protein SM033_00234 [Vibrio phage vB_VpaM_sm033]|nr:hypothetical protein SM033_00234 [Vibrio phage vB_VpaM_sm033]
MDIQLNEFEIHQTLQADSFDLERAGILTDELSRLHRFVATAAPTEQNLAVAESMIESFNGAAGKELITFTKGEMLMQMHGLDEEGLKDTGTRIYRSISRIISRIVAFLRNLWRSFFNKDENRTKKIQTQMELIDEQITAAELLYKQLKLSHGDSFTEKGELAKQVEEVKGVVFLSPKGTKLVDPAHVRTDVFSTVNRAKLEGEAILQLVEKGGVIGQTPQAVIDRVEAARKLLELGVDTDLFSIGKRLLAITTERDITEAIQVISDRNGDYKRLEGLSSSYSKSGFDLGINSIKVRADMAAGVKSLVGSKGPNLMKATRSTRVNGNFGLDDIKKLESARSDVVEVRKSIQNVVEIYLKELEAYAGDNGNTLREAAKKVAEVQVSAIVKPHVPTVQKALNGFHNVLRKEMKVFEDAVVELDLLDTQISALLGSLMNFTTFPGRPEK